MPDDREKRLYSLKHKSSAVIPSVSRVHARSVRHHVVLHQSSVAAFRRFNNVGFAYNASSGASRERKASSLRCTHAAQVCSNFG